MILSFHPCFDADIHIILGSRQLGLKDLELIRQAEAIILPQGCPANLYRTCSDTKAHIFPSYEMRFRYPGKTGQSILFGNFGFPHPKTLRFRSTAEFTERQSIAETFLHNLPFFIKTDKAHEAEGVFLVEGEDSLSDALDHLSRCEKRGQGNFVTQDFIDSGGNVLRAVIMGKRIITYWKLPAKPGQLITTISRGAIIDHHRQPQLQKKGKELALILSGKTGINLAAIDFVFQMSKEDPPPFFLEINYSFGRRGLGGMEKYYQMLYGAIENWLEENKLSRKSVRLL